MQSVDESLEGRITRNFETLTPKQQVLARLILENRYLASFASAAEIGERVEASAATVVRLCQALGYEGLPDLQAALRSELPSYLTAVQRMEQRQAAGGNDGSTAARAFATDIRNLERTAELVAAAPFAQIAETLAGAREVVVVAGGVVGPVAHSFAYSLRVIGLQVRTLLDGDVAQVVGMAHLAREDVVVVMGVWRYIVSSVEALIWARQAGARTIAISDSIVSPLAREADFALAVATEGVAHSLSTTSMVTLANALVADIALRTPERTRSALLRIEKQLLDRRLVQQ